MSENNASNEQIPFNEKTKKFIEEQIAILTKPVDSNGRVLAGSLMSKETIRAVYEHVNLERDMVIRGHFNEIAKMSVVEQLTEIQRVKEIDERERREEEDEVIFIDRGSNLIDDFPDKWPRGERDEENRAIDEYDERMITYKRNRKLIQYNKDRIAEFEVLDELLNNLTEESIEFNLQEVKQEVVNQFENKINDLELPNKSIYTPNHLHLL